MSASVEHDEFQRLPDVMRRTGLGRSLLYELMAAGEFPQSYKIGKRAVAWRASQVSAWMASREPAKQVGEAA